MIFRVKRCSDSSVRYDRPAAHSPRFTRSFLLNPAGALADLPASGCRIRVKRSSSFSITRGRRSINANAPAATTIERRAQLGPAMAPTALTINGQTLTAAALGSFHEHARSHLLLALDDQHPVHPKSRCLKLMARRQQAKCCLRFWPSSLRLSWYHSSRAVARRDQAQRRA